METNLRRVRDIVSIKRTIWSNYDRFRTLGVFYLERNAVLDAVCAMSDGEIAQIAADCREGGVRWRSFTKYLNKIESALLGNREIADLGASDEKAFDTVAGVPAAEFVRIHESASGVAVSFNVTGTFDLLLREQQRLHGDPEPLRHARDALHRRERAAALLGGSLVGRAEERSAQLRRRRGRPEARQEGLRLRAPVRYGRHPRRRGRPRQIYRHIGAHPLDQSVTPSPRPAGSGAKKHNSGA